MVPASLKAGGMLHNSTKIQSDARVRKKEGSMMKAAAVLVVEVLVF